MRKRTEIARLQISVAIGCLLAVGTSLAAHDHDDDACGVSWRQGRPHYVESTFSGVVKVAAVQTSPRMFDNAYNLGVMLSKTDEAAQNGASLVAFPELSLTAYKYSSTAEAMLYAEPVPGPSTDAMAAKAVERRVFVVFGLLEKAGEDVFDTVAFVGPEGYIGKYRKVHQGYRSESLVFSRGTQPPPVFATSIGRIGLANCYDGAFPETARLLGLQGADIMVFIYNESGAVWRDYVLSRGAENNAFVLAPNRIGSERLSSFNGGSFIGAPGMQMLASAGATAEQTVYADLDLSSLGASAYTKRRPELYEAVAESYPAQILSSDITPEANVTGSTQDVAVTIVTSSLDLGTPVVAELQSDAGAVVARVAGRLGCNRKRLTLSVPAGAAAGSYAVHVTATPREGEPQSVVLPYTIKPTQKPVAMGRLPVGSGATVSGSVYVSYDINVNAGTKIPIKLIGPTSTTTLSASVNTSGLDNRLGASYSGLAYGGSYTVVVPAGSVQSVDYGTTNDELSFQFTVQPSPLVFKAAAVQMTPGHLAVSTNLDTMLAKLGEAAAAGAKLVVFPEFALTGNGFASQAEAAGVAEEVSGPSVAQLTAKATELGVYVVFGMVEKEPPFCGHGHCWYLPWHRPDLYSTMVLVGPSGLVGTYRKTHVSETGDDQFLREGIAPSEVFETDLGPIGLSAGNDVYYPEAARSLFVRGALIIASGQSDEGTLWPQLARTRASENKVYYVAANRVGVEGGKTYGGLSIMAYTSRGILVQATSSSEAIVYANLNMYDIQKRIYAYIDRPTGKVKATDYNFDRSPFLYRDLAWHPGWQWQAPRHHGFDRFRLWHLGWDCNDGGWYDGGWND